MAESLAIYHQLVTGSIPLAHLAGGEAETAGRLGGVAAP
jgi:hypothetical protein